MAAATIVRADKGGPEEPGSDRLLLAFVRLCRQLERPVSEAELRAGVEIPPDGADLACLERMAARAGFALRTTKMNTRALARLPTPFLIVGREPHQSWLVRARTVDQLVLVEPTHGGTTACTRRAAVALGTHLVRLCPRSPARAASGVPPCCTGSGASSGRSASRRWSSTSWRSPRRCS